MSVLIKGMEMPTSCMDCPFKGFDRARGRGNICTINDSITFHAVLDGVDVKFVRMGDCPLVPVPPHGRLIDSDAAIALIQEEKIKGETLDIIIALGDGLQAETLNQACDRHIKIINSLPVIDV